MLRQYSPLFKRPLITIQPGEYYVTQGDEVVGTVLGSCVSVCLRDTRSGVGGMNHFMLPTGKVRANDTFSAEARYGMYAMELLIGEIIKQGGGRRYLEAKVFGGGQVLNRIISGAYNVARANLEFVEHFLRLEEIPVAASDVAGEYVRKIFYEPVSGRVLLKRLPAPVPGDILEAERSHGKTALERLDGDDLTLFESAKPGVKGHQE
ncbi:MAG: hypothetical protein K9K65_08170 [Desulfarculaceae bacterium]|nr:hypothetical protein [Desulfarculaceae bacterium]MCF8047253.1 hypothetical protein [Desulfarculaceae bacterium]MCF8065768.1 hypothetical protein [Desulfarculaceae bacterium]MCF8097802.1 hypothetical protein [Desulfarculaceae bacterium]MCF8122341.1 hypothetical protein [Desulfarculaceae bacterium]